MIANTAIPLYFFFLLSFSLSFLSIFLCLILLGSGHYQVLALKLCYLQFFLFIFSDTIKVVYSPARIFSLAWNIYDHQLYTSLVSGYKYLNESTNPLFKSSVIFSLSSFVNPALCLLVEGFFKSISLCATFRSPHKITGF